MRMRDYLFMIPVILIVSIPGCLETDHPTAEGISSSSVMGKAAEVAGAMEGDRDLVAVTGKDPAAGGKAGSWKFTYNEGGAGAYTSSVSILIDMKGVVRTDHGGPLSKSPVRNWSVDSSSAYSICRDQLIENGMISPRTDVKVIFIYLLGDAADNHGCVWTLGLVLGENAPAEVTIRIDGSTGGLLNIINSRK